MLNKGTSFSVSLGLLCTPKETLGEEQPCFGTYFLVYFVGLVDCPTKKTSLKIIAGKDDSLPATTRIPSPVMALKHDCSQLPLELTAVW